MKKIIVVADDDSICRLILSMNLNKVKVPVLYAEDGQEAFIIINNLISEYDEILLFTDLNMPILNGFELISLLKDIPKDISCRIKIVVTSSHSFFEVDNKIVKPIFGYIKKPVTPKAIGTFINDYIDIDSVILQPI